MKARLLIALLALAGIFTACKKNKKEEIECCRVCCKAPDNFMDAQKAGTTWNTNKVTLSYHNDSLIILANKNNENLRLGLKVTGTGKYLINQQNGSYNVTVGGDAIAAEYRAAADTSNYINITTYDKSIRLIHGEFNIKLIKDARYTNTDLGNEVSFVKGRLRAALPE